MCTVLPILLPQGCALSLCPDYRDVRCPDDNDNYVGGFATGCSTISGHFQSLPMLLLTVTCWFLETWKPSKPGDYRRRAGLLYEEDAARMAEPKPGNDGRWSL